MAVLLLHPQDDFLAFQDEPWDLIVDLGRSPSGTYQRWGRNTGCKIIGLYDFAEEIEDLYRLRGLLKCGTGYLVDESGTDWWDVLFHMISPDLLQCMLVLRLAKHLRANTELVCSRPDRRAELLSEWIRGKLTCRGGRANSIARWIAHYRDVLSQHDRAQIS